MTTPASESHQIPLLAGIARRVRMAVEADADGLGTLIRSMVGRGDPFVKPNSDGTWPTQTRLLSNPGTLMWLRHIGDTGQLAPMPTQADGYIPGDLVAPGPGTTTEPTEPGDTTTPTENVLFSDSFIVSTDSNFTTRNGDAYAGGSAPVWQSDISQKVADGHVRTATNTGLNMYSKVWCRSTAPALPSTGAWKVTFRITELGINNTIRMVLRAPTYNDTSANTILALGNSGGTLVASTVDTIAGSGTIGQAPFTVGTSVVSVTFDGTNVTVGVDDNQFATGTVPTTNPRLTELVFYAHTYLKFAIRDLKVVTL